MSVCLIKSMGGRRKWGVRTGDIKLIERPCSRQKSGAPCAALGPSGFIYREKPDIRKSDGPHIIQDTFRSRGWLGRLRLGEWRWLSWPRGWGHREGRRLGWATGRSRAGVACCREGWPEGPGGSREAWASTWVDSKPSNGAEQGVV